MKLVKIILRNGCVIKFECESVTVTKNTISGSLQEIKWKSATKGDVPLCLDISEVIAVTTEALEGEK